MAENKKIRIGNDIHIEWTLLDGDSQPYILTGRDISIEVVIGMKKARIKEFSVNENVVSFTYFGKDQKYTGNCDLKFIENDGEREMVTFDIQSAFALVSHSWEAVDAGETPETIQLEFVTVTSELVERVGPKGDTGDPAGFGEVTAEVDGNVGTPSVSVETSGPDTAKNFHFAFSNLKGEPGQDASVTAENIKAALGYTPADEDNVNAALASKQDTLESGTNIKTFAGESLLGSGKFGRMVEIMWGGSSSSREALYVQIEGGAVFLVSHGNNAALVIIKHPSDFDFIPLTKGSKWVVGMPPYSPQTGRRVCFYDWTNNAQGVSGEYWFYPIHFPGTPATKAITIGKTAANSFTDDQSHVIEYYTKPVAGIPKTDLADDVKTSLSKADSTDERMTASQTKIAWLDPFIWTGEQVWPKEEGGGSVDVDVKQLLRSAPSLIVRGSKSDDKVIYVSHPLSDYPGAEIVLMHYAKKNVKLDDHHHRMPKKGYCVAVGGIGGEARYFTFGAETSYSALYDYCEGYLGLSPTGHFGIALRIPNPEWTRSATMHKNATYKGIPESLWSDVLRIGLSYDEENNAWGLGIK